jgi:hypothetical protein
MTHLGQRLSALIDEELDGAERDRALSHLARCESCRAEVSALRVLKRRMNALGETAADAELTGRLIGLAGLAGLGSMSGGPEARAPWPSASWPGLPGSDRMTAGSWHETGRPGWHVLGGSLAVLGLYGVIAYMVARRRNEIGVRIALGASRGSVIGLVLREAVVLLAIGLTVGTGFALWAGRAAASLVYGMTPRDPLTLGGAVVLLGAVALIASYGPAWKASRLQPMDALRDE